MPRSEQLTAQLKIELRYLGLRYGGRYFLMNDADRQKFIDKWKPRRLQEQATAAELAAKQTEEPVDFARLSKDLIGTQGPLGSRTGGGKRNIRSTKGMS